MVGNSQRVGPRRGPRVAGGTRSQPNAPGRSVSDDVGGRRKAIVAGAGAVVLALLIAWLTPAGPWVWEKVFPGPTISASVSFYDGACGSFLVPINSTASLSDS